MPNIKKRGAKNLPRSKIATLPFTIRFTKHNERPLTQLFRKVDSWMRWYELSNHTQNESIIIPAINDNAISPYSRHFDKATCKLNTTKLQKLSFQHYK